MPREEKIHGPAMWPGKQNGGRSLLSLGRRRGAHTAAQGTADGKPVGFQPLALVFLLTAGETSGFWCPFFCWLRLSSDWPGPPRRLPGLERKEKIKQNTKLPKGFAEEKPLGQGEGKNKQTQKNPRTFLAKLARINPAKGNEVTIRVASPPCWRETLKTSHAPTA